MFEQIQQAIFPMVCGSWLSLHMPDDKKGNSSASKAACENLQQNRAVKETFDTRHFHKSC